MQLYKCKNSVFCILFLFTFCLGTTSGVFLFRCFLCGQNYIELAYGLNVVTIKYPLLWLRPILLMSALIIHPEGYRFVFPLVFVRAVLVSYLFSALWVYGLDISTVLLNYLLFLPIYFIISKRAFGQWGKLCDRIY